MAANQGPLTAAELNCTYGFLYVQILSHLALLWGNKSGEWDLLELFKENAMKEDALSEAAKRLTLLIIDQAEMSVKATLDEIKAGGVKGLN